MVITNNGTELTSTAMLRWQQETGTDWHYMAPLKPKQNGSSRASTGVCTASY